MASKMRPRILHYIRRSYGRLLPSSCGLPPLRRTRSLAWFGHGPGRIAQCRSARTSSQGLGPSSASRCRVRIPERGVADHGNPQYHLIAVRVALKAHRARSAPPPKLPRHRHPRPPPGRHRRKVRGLCWFRRPSAAPAVPGRSKHNSDMRSSRYWRGVHLLGSVTEDSPGASRPTRYQRPFFIHGVRTHSALAIVIGEVQQATVLVAMRSHREHRSRVRAESSAAATGPALAFCFPCTGATADGSRLVLTP